MFEFHLHLASKLALKMEIIIRHLSWPLYFSILSWSIHIGHDEIKDREKTETKSKRERKNIKKLRDFT